MSKFSHIRFSYKQNLLHKHSVMRVLLQFAQLSPTKRSRFSNAKSFLWDRFAVNRAHIPASIYFYKCFPMFCFCCWCCSEWTFVALVSSEKSLLGYSLPHLPFIVSDRSLSSNKVLLMLQVRKISPVIQGRMEGCSKRKEEIIWS